MIRKTSTLFMLLLLTGAVALCQAANAQSSGRLPSFAMTLSNGQYFKAADLPKGKPVLLIYFAPDCDHCHTLMNEFFKRVGEFKSAEVVMVTFKPVSDVAAFEQAYQTYLNPNIKVGTEGATNFLRLFYKLQNTPFTALYNREGKLVSTYRKEPPLNELLKQLKQL
jgi:cytochrome oxidase Cu insertion factor (SCO1/SenC/PrrC family)